ncbi:HesA/MoeB/ThiF family protein [bacterium]|nr:HesA/MoeB/ThiF family protein [bacterium]
MHTKNQNTPPPFPRYSRQTALPELGAEGQQRLHQGRVLIVGLGGLGSPAALYLAAAGVGHLGLVDSDRLDESNLQRQIAHSTADIGRLKVESAAERLERLNPHVRIHLHPSRLNVDNAASLFGEYDVIVDGTDSFFAKFLIADACHQTGTAYVHGGVRRYIGQAMIVLPGKTCCYRCVFGGDIPEEPGPPAGPLGPVPGVIGSVQALECIKFLAHFGELLTDRIFTYDGLSARARVVPVRRNPACQLCGTKQEPPVASGSPTERIKT